MLTEAVNIHGCCWVKLSEYGETTYVEFLKSIGIEPHPVEKDKHGWSMFSLFQLMLIFGSKCHSQEEDQFVGNIIYFCQPESDYEGCV